MFVGFFVDWKVVANKKMLKHLVLDFFLRLCSFTTNKNGWHFFGQRTLGVKGSKTCKGGISFVCSKQRFDNQKFL